MQKLNGTFRPASSPRLLFFSSFHLALRIFPSQVGQDFNRIYRRWFSSLQNLSSTYFLFWLHLLKTWVCPLLCSAKTLSGYVLDYFSVRSRHQAPCFRGNAYPRAPGEWVRCVLSETVARAIIMPPRSRTTLLGLPPAFLYPLNSGPAPATKLPA